MTFIETYKKIAYTIGFGGGIASGYVAAYLTSKHMGFHDCNLSAITIGALASKEAGFFSGNIVAHSLANSFCYNNFSEWTKDVKRLSLSNVGCISFGLAVKPAAHAVLMYCGMEPEKAMLWSYIPVGILGLGLKAYLDNRFAKKNSLNLEDKVCPSINSISDI